MVGPFPCSVPSSAPDRVLPLMLPQQPLAPVHPDRTAGHVPRAIRNEEADDIGDIAASARLATGDGDLPFGHSTGIAVSSGCRRLVLSSMPVSISPGQTALTRMWCFASSSASCWTIATCAAFVAV